MNYPTERSLWYLIDGLTYLNHGSFGATPKQIMQRFFQLNELVEENPMKFYLEIYPELIGNSRKSISEFLNSEPDKIAFVDNATTGVNSVLRSLQNKINSDWEILTTDHYYPAVKNTLNYISEMTGCKIVVAEVPDFVESSGQLFGILINAVTSQTKLLVIDHITSVSGIIFPVQEIIDYCKRNDILILIDGAHAPGFLNLNLGELNPDWFTGNLHKWLFTPKSVGILYVAKPENPEIHPTVISNDYDKGFTKEFDWVGTRNFCSWLTVPECIDFHRKYFDYDYCRELSIYSRELLIKDSGLHPMAHEKLTGLMQSFWLPESAGSKIEDVLALRQKLLSRYGIEVFLNPFKGRIVLRITSQIYNSENEYSMLVRALKEIL